jgi:hypothetical protein
LTSELLRSFTFRNVSPFRMGARASAIAVPASPQKDHLYTFYVSTWTGGVFKTINGGTTFKPVFDTQNELTIGAVSVAPSNASIVWVGTGDHYNSRSSYPGDGIYKSIDAGETWANMGLRDSHHISRIVIHPTNPEIVYVSVMGHLYTPNQERGVFRTTDGGKHWERVLFVNDEVGAIDLVMNLKNPGVLYAATYDKRRTAEMHLNAGPESGIYRTTDAGKSWSRLKGGTSRRADWPHRPRHLPRESRGRVRGREQRQSAREGAGSRMHGRAACGLRRRRRLSHAGCGPGVDEGERRRR